MQAARQSVPLAPALTPTRNAIVTPTDIPVYMDHLGLQARAAATAMAAASTAAKDAALRALAAQLREDKAALQAVNAVDIAAAEATGTSDLSNNSLKVIADHIRAAAFLVIDGVVALPSGCVGRRAVGVAVLAK